MANAADRRRAGAPNGTEGWWRSRPTGEARGGRRRNAPRVRLRRTLRRASMATTAPLAAGCALLAFAGGARADAAAANAFPAAGQLVQPTSEVLAAPRAGAKRLALVRQFRPDYRPQIVLATGAWSDRAGRLWYRVEIPSKGRLAGWMVGRALSVEPVAERLLIRRGARLLELYRGPRLVLRTRVAVGKPGAETPLGRFYVTAKFQPTLPVLGKYALETSAHSRLSDWPGGGIVGIHGTPHAWQLGRALSHGCIRVHDPTILKLKTLVPLGTPITIVR